MRTGSSSGWASATDGRQTPARRFGVALAFVVTSALLLTDPVRAQSTGKTPSRPAASAADDAVVQQDSARLVEEIREVQRDLHAKQAALGRRPDREPSIAIERATGLLYYAHSRRLLIVPLWSAMGPQARALYVTIAGDSAGARKAFEDIVWFYVPHDLGHQFLNESGVAFTPWEHEYTASAMALAFRRERGELQRLREIRTLAESAVQRMAPLDPTPPGEDRRAYFNREYRKVLSNPEAYAFIQLVMLAELLAEPQPKTLAELSAALPPRP